MVKQCTLRKPLMMVIPTKGITISCPIHKNGHFIRGRDNMVQQPKFSSRVWRTGISADS